MLEQTIKCPRCGYEYLPSEIYIPNVFFGKPTFIQRDLEGHIYDVIGIPPDRKEEYVCDNCGAAFKVRVHIEFISKIDKEKDFNEDYETDLNV